MTNCDSGADSRIVDESSHGDVDELAARRQFEQWQFAA
jgi:hypothetical protein